MSTAGFYRTRLYLSRVPIIFTVKRTATRRAAIEDIIAQGQGRPEKHPVVKNCQQAMIA